MGRTSRREPAPASDDREAAAGAAPSRGRRGTAPSWATFERRLARAIERMPDESFLILATLATAGRPGYFVQYAQATTVLRAEAVSSAYLPPSAPLSEQQEATLIQLGWSWPEPDEKGRNAYRTWNMPAPAPEAARLAVETLRTVYEVESPSDLRFTHARFAGGSLRDPGLGIPSAEERLSSRPRPGSQPRGRTAAMARLRRELEAALADFIGAPRVWADQDGDYPLRTGSALYFVRILDGVPPAIAVFSPVLREVRASAALYEALNDVNRRLRYARVFEDRGGVYIALELPAVGLTAEHVAFACVQLGSMADSLDDLLHGRFGGEVAFDVSPKLLN